MGTGQGVEGKKPRLDNDRRMRTFGWARAASRIAAKLDPGTRGLLEAYCEGVNASFAAQQKAGTLHPLFKQLEVAPEKWTPADCLLSWWHVAQFFAGDGTRDLMVWRNRTAAATRRTRDRRNPAPPGWMIRAAVVQREDVSEEWLREVEQFCATRALTRAGVAATRTTRRSSAMRGWWEARGRPRVRRCW